MLANPPRGPPAARPAHLHLRLRGGGVRGPRHLHCKCLQISRHRRTHKGDRFGRATDDITVTRPGVGEGEGEKL
jgi:hypothetical protein